MATYRFDENPEPMTFRDARGDPGRSVEAVHFLESVAAEPSSSPETVALVRTISTQLRARFNLNPVDPDGRPA